MPASICAIPPVEIAMPRTTLDWETTPAVTVLSPKTSVVHAKAKKPSEFAVAMLELEAGRLGALWGWLLILSK